MKRIMLRMMIWMAATAAALVILAGLVYVYVIHPDDGRVIPADVASLSPLPGHAIAGTLLSSESWEHLVSPAEFYADHRRVFADAQANAIVLSSKRFTTKDQMYLAVGEYPFRLEGHDGIYVPDGGTLTVQTPLYGEHLLRFPAYADGSVGQVEVQLGGQRVAAVALPQPAYEVRERGFWHRQFGRFLWPDRDREVRRWHTVDATVFLEPDMPIEIKCLNAPLGCVIGDVKALVREQAAPRSVLMILVDTMRFDAADRGHAPRLAALGESGTTFRRAISPGNMTSPSTNALLACRTASDLGRMAFAYAVNKNHRERHYENGPESFPAAFRRAGFTTAMIGNVSVLSEIFGVGVNHGFQQQIAIESDAYDTPLIARATIDWLKAHGSEPFFLYVHLHGPHAAYRAPWRDIRATKPATGAFASYPNILRWLYQSEIHYTDRYLGQILDAVQRLGLSETTNIALTSDHGDMHTQHEFSGNEAGPSFSGSYFDHGATLLNDEIRVPLMFSGPGVRAGQVVDGVTSTLAVGPTLLSLVGLEPISACGARSLAAELDGSPPPSPPPVVGSEAFQGRAVIMDGRYKYIRMYTPVDKRVYREGAFDSPHRMFLRRHQLYDLDTDPHETRDLSASDPDLLERAEVTYKQYFSIRTMFELVIDAPDRPAIAVHVPWPWRAKRSLGAATVAVTDEDRMVTTSGEARVILELSTDAATDVARAVPLPTVVVGGQSLPIRMTSMRLPLDVALDDLPIESGGAGSLLPPVGAGAILRRVDDDGQRERRINVGNPAFDKVLREWGYLND